MKVSTISVEVNIKVKVSMWAVIKWRLLGLNKKEITINQAGEVIECNIKEWDW